LRWRSLTTALCPAEKSLEVCPSGLDCRKLVFNQWWTQIPGKADEKRTFRTDAFYSDYLITLKGKTKKVSISKKKTNRCKWLFNSENFSDCSVTSFLPVLTVVQDF
jgi:hypothetical protein